MNVGFGEIPHTTETTIIPGARSHTPGESTVMQLGPMPFRLPVPGEESLTGGGVHSTSFKVFGFLHLEDEGISLEWTGRETEERFGLMGIKTEVRELPVDWVDVPYSWLRSAVFKGGFWWPRLVLRSANLDAFVDVPSGTAIGIKLRVARSDRYLAREIADAIQDRIDGNFLEDSTFEEIVEWNRGELPSDTTDPGERTS